MTQAEAGYDDPQWDIAHKNQVMWNYIMILANWLIPFIDIIALIIAYAQRGSANPLRRSHFTYQITTFWYGFLYKFVFGSFLITYVVRNVVPLVDSGDPTPTFAFSNTFMLLASLMMLPKLWIALRCTMGLVNNADNKPMPRPHHFLLW